MIFFLMWIGWLQIDVFIIYGRKVRKTKGEPKQRFKNQNSLKGKKKKIIYILNNNNISSIESPQNITTRTINSISTNNGQRTCTRFRSLSLCFKTEASKKPSKNVFFDFISISKNLPHWISSIFSIYKPPKNHLLHFFIFIFWNP